MPCRSPTRCANGPEEPGSLVTTASRNWPSARNTCWETCPSGNRIFAKGSTSCCGHSPTCYPDGTVAGIRLSYAVEPTPLDTAGAIRFAADHVGIDDTFLVVNGDVL